MQANPVGTAAHSDVTDKRIADAIEKELDIIYSTMDVGADEVATCVEAMIRKEFPGIEILEPLKMEVTKSRDAQTNWGTWKMVVGYPGEPDRLLRRDATKDPKSSRAETT